MKELHDLRFAEPIRVTRPTPVSLEQYQQRLGPVFERDWFTNQGPEHQQLESRLRDALGTPGVALFNNGTQALLSGLVALDLPVGAKVITTPFTFPATVDALHFCGLEPVFADIDPHSFNLDPAAVDDAVDHHTACILAVHCYGVPCDVDGLDAIARRRGLRVVYDAAPAFGVRHRGVPLARYGDLTMLSFHATKVMSTVEGGAVVTADSAVFDRVLAQRSFGMDRSGVPRGPGLNGKLSEVHAVFGLLCLDALDAEVARRSERSAHWRRALHGVPGLSYQRVPADTEWNHGYFPVRIDADSFGRSRDDVFDTLASINVQARRYFFPLCSDIAPFSAHPSAGAHRLPVARRVAAEVLCLPLYGALPFEAIDRIAEAIRRMAATA